MKRLILVLLLSAGMAHGEEWLLTPEEAAEYRLSAEDLAGFDPAMTRRDAGVGPAIQILAPTVRQGAAGQERLETAEEFSLSVRFEKPTAGSPAVDMILQPFCGHPAH